MDDDDDNGTTDEDVIKEPVRKRDNDEATVDVASTDDDDTEVDDFAYKLDVFILLLTGSNNCVAADVVFKLVVKSLIFSSKMLVDARLLPTLRTFMTPFELGTTRTFDASSCYRTGSLLVTKSPRVVRVVGIEVVVKIGCSHRAPVARTRKRRQKGTDTTEAYPTRECVVVDLVAMLTVVVVAVLVIPMLLVVLFALSLLIIDVIPLLLVLEYLARPFVFVTEHLGFARLGNMPEFTMTSSHVHRSRI